MLDRSVRVFHRANIHNGWVSVPFIKQAYTSSLLLPQKFRNSSECRLVYMKMELGTEILSSSIKRNENLYMWLLPLPPRALCLFLLYRSLLSAKSVFNAWLTPTSPPQCSPFSKTSLKYEMNSQRKEWKRLLCWNKWRWRETLCGEEGRRKVHVDVNEV